MRFTTQNTFIDGHTLLDAIELRNESYSSAAILYCAPCRRRELQYEVTERIVVIVSCTLIASEYLAGKDAAHKRQEFSQGTAAGTAQASSCDTTLNAREASWYIEPLSEHQNPGR